MKKFHPHQLECLHRDGDTTVFPAVSTVSNALSDAFPKWANDFQVINTSLEITIFSDQNLSRKWICRENELPFGFWQAASMFGVLTEACRKVSDPDGLIPKLLHSPKELLEKFPVLAEIMEYKENNPSDLDDKRLQRAVANNTKEITRNALSAEEADTLFNDGIQNAIEKDELPFPWMCGAPDVDIENAIKKTKALVDKSENIAAVSRAANNFAVMIANLPMNLLTRPEKVVCSVSLPIIFCDYLRQHGIPVNAEATFPTFSVLINGVFGIESSISFVEFLEIKNLATGKYANPENEEMPEAEMKSIFNLAYTDFSGAKNISEEHFSFLIKKIWKENSH